VAGVLRGVRAADAPTPLQVARLKFDERAVLSAARCVGLLPAARHAWLLRGGSRGAARGSRGGRCGRAALARAAADDP
jgi:hypothetical protein